MKDKNFWKNFSLGCIGYILLFAIILGISWIGTCGIIKLITLCFGWKFSWAGATGAWLILSLLSSIFSSHTTVKK